MSEVGAPGLARKCGHSCHASGAQDCPIAQPRSAPALPQQIVVCRHPDDCAAVARDPALFPKSHSIERVYSWLGEGLLSTQDLGHHDAMKEVRRQPLHARRLA